jgi:hypothetical protein
MLSSSEGAASLVVLGEGSGTVVGSAGLAIMIEAIACA